MISNKSVEKLDILKSINLNRIIIPMEKYPKGEPKYSAGISSSMPKEYSGGVNL